LRGLAAQLSHLSGGLPSSYHRDHQLLKAPLVEIVRDAEQLFRVVARLVPALEVNEQACAAAMTPEIYAAREACRRAADGTSFRDAYLEVAADIERGSYAPPSESSFARDLGLDEITAQLNATEKWLADRRAFLAATRARLFDWK
ncbi:MAG TPA: hypothetical protein VGC85_09005, partial [Chthoniobacterales bacterium]